MSYVPEVEAYFFKPQHVGELPIDEQGVHYIQLGLPSQSDYFILYVLIDEKYNIIKACFKASGNPYLLAGLEWICCQLQSSALDNLIHFRKDAIISFFQMPPRFLPTALLLENGYNTIVKSLSLLRDAKMSEVMQHISTNMKPISLTDKAREHLIHYLNKQEPLKGVRFSVKKTGCSGLSYVIDYLKESVEEDIVEPLTANYNIYIDKKSYPYLKGMQIDYVTEGLNSKFIFKNPNQTGQCGCGESFTVDSEPDEPPD